MKIVVFFISLIFFSTQIIPLKYVSYLCDYDLCENTNEDDCDDEMQLKDKIKTEKEVYLNNTFSYKSQHTSSLSTTKSFSVFSFFIPDDYISNILVPPPNC